jgi:hypothetical protein
MQAPAAHQQVLRLERELAAIVVPELVASLRRGGGPAIRAVTVCVELSSTGHNAELSRCGAVGAAVALLGSSARADAAAASPACQLLTRLCSQCPPNASAAVAAGCLPPLARLCGGGDAAVAFEAYAALLAVVLAEGPLAAIAQAEAAAEAGALDAAARLVARPRGGAGDRCLVPALQLLALATTLSVPLADRVAASGALSGAVALLRAPDSGLARAALNCVHNATWTSAAARRAVALEPAAAPALIEWLMAAPAGGGPLPNQPYFAAAALGAIAEATMGRARAGAAPNAVASDVRRAGGVTRMVELLRDVLGGALPDDGRFPRKLWVVSALSVLLVLDADARPAALAAGAVPLLARVVAGVGASAIAGASTLDGDGRLLNALDALKTLGDVPQGGRAALAAQPGLAATVARILNAGLDGWLQAAPAERREGAMARAACLLAAMLQTGDEVGTTAASEVASAGGARSLVRLGAVLGAGAAARHHWPTPNTASHRHDHACHAQACDSAFPHRSPQVRWRGPRVCCGGSAVAAGGGAGRLWQTVAERVAVRRARPRRSSGSSAFGIPRRVGH